MARGTYIFIHIPKTAGRSILTALGLKIDNQHRTIADYCKLLGEDVFRSRFKFTCVRNPWDRAVSWWAFFGGMGPQERDPSFAAWVTRLGKRKRNPGVRVPLDQFSYLRSPTGEVLIDQFLRFEHLAEDWPAVAKRLGAAEQLPRVGARGRSDEMMRKHRKLPPVSANYRDLYTSQELIDIVANFDSETITRFGYTF